LTETYTYDAFGTLTEIQSLNENGILTETETAISRFLYAGEQYDSITGLYYLRARRFDTTAGRFTQEDTYLGDGRNLYVYVGNNPLRYVDPSGYCEKSLGVELLLGGIDDIATLAKDVKHTRALKKAAKEIAENATDVDDAIGIIKGAKVGRLGDFLGDAKKFANNAVDHVKKFADDVKKGADEAIESVKKFFKGGSHSLPEINFETSKLQHEYKHAGDFGIEGNWNKSKAAEYQQAIQNHIDNASDVYLSTYRGQKVYVYYNPETGLGSYVDMNGNYVSGWRLSEKQIEFHTTNGKKIK